MLPRQMPRQARVVAVGVPHHVTQRGNNRQDIFLLDEDRQFYLETLTGCCRRYRLTVLGYCLMTNHVHLVVVPHAPNALSQALGNTHQLHAQRFNRRYGRSGHAWQNRFFSCPLGPDRAVVALAYADLNPVRSGMVGRAESWPWSSARAHLSQQDSTGLIDLEACRRWCDLDGWGHVLATGGFTAEGALLRRATAIGRAYGDETFATQIARASRDLPPAERANTASA